MIHQLRSFQFNFIVRNTPETYFKDGLTGRGLTCCSPCQSPAPPLHVPYAVNVARQHPVPLSSQTADLMPTAANTNKIIA